MVSRIGMLVAEIIGFLVVAPVACGGTVAMPTPTHSPVVVPSTSQPTAPATTTVTGTVTYREQIELAPGAVVEVKLIDISRADAPAITIGQQIIENPAQVPIAFEIEYDPTEIDQRFTYAIQARIMESDRLAFTNDTTYQVITRDSPNHVDMVLVQVGGTRPEPTSAAPTKVEVLAPIDDVEINIAESFPLKYFVLVQSGLPNSCHEFNKYEVDRDGDTVRITVTNIKSEGAVCAQVYGTTENSIALGSDFEGGRTYSVHVNNVIETFVAQPTGAQLEEPEGPAMISVLAPVQSVRVNVSEPARPEYSLMVLSVLPKGTTCSKFEEYQMIQEGATVSVTITNLEVAPGQLIPCTADIGYTETEVPLGSGLTSGETYTVVVNEQVTNSFLVRDDRSAGWVLEASPMESAELVTLDSEPPQYSLNVVSRLPRGSSCSAFNGYDVARRFAGRIEVTVTHLEVAHEIAACTRDLPIVVTEIPLGSDFRSGDTYDVVLNGDLIESFVAN